jgi:hypothetical protein
MHFSRSRSLVSSYLRSLAPADAVDHGRSSGVFNSPWTASEAIRIFIDGVAVLFNP